jgi:hypothetical protein
MKKIIIALLIYTTLCTVAFAQNESDFIFDGKGTITGYLVKIPTRSLGLSNTGAEVWAKFVSSSFATTCASVFLPSPAGKLKKVDQGFRHVLLQHR